MYTQLRRSSEEIKNDSPCIGVCTLNEENICIGCDRTIEEIIEAGKENTLHIHETIVQCLKSYRSIVWEKRSHARRKFRQAKGGAFL